VRLRAVVGVVGVRDDAELRKELSHPALAPWLGRLHLARQSSALLSSNTYLPAMWT
jgi:hypothetical protein